MNLKVNSVSLRTFSSATLGKGKKSDKVNLEEVKFDELVKKAPKSSRKSFIEKLRDFLYGP